MNLVPFGQRGQPSVGRQGRGPGRRGRRAGRGGSLRLRPANPGPSASPGRSDPASPVDRPTVKAPASTTRPRAPRRPRRYFPAGAGSSATRSRAGRASRPRWRLVPAAVRSGCVSQRLRRCSAVVRSSLQRNGTSCISVVYSSLRPASSAASAVSFAFLSAAAAARAFGWRGVRLRPASASARRAFSFSSVSSWAISFLPPGLDQSPRRARDAGQQRQQRPGRRRSPRRGASGRTSAVRYARLGGAATTGSCARCRRMSAAKPLAVS